MESIKNRVSQDPSSPMTYGAEASSASAPQSGAVPAHTPVRQEERGTNLVEKYVAHATQQSARQEAEARMCLAEPPMTAGTLAFTGKMPAQASSAKAEKAHAKQPHKFLRSDGKPFPVSKDGTPMYAQNDRAKGGGWGAEALRNVAKDPVSIGSQGCAVTSIAMVLSKLTGQTITPRMVDAHLDANDGYLYDREGKGTNGVNWGKACLMAEPPVTATRVWKWDLQAIDASLESGRPVAIGVDYRLDENVDHWVVLTRKGAEEGTYFANDPAGGKEILFKKDENGRLVEVQAKEVQDERAPYKSTGDFVTFKPKPQPHVRAER